MSEKKACESISSHDEESGNDYITTILSANGEQVKIATVLSPTGQEVKITKDVDDAMELAMRSKNITVTPEQDRKLVRKIDMYMFPLMMLLYSIQYMDKISSSSASIMGLKTDLHMVGQDYSWVGSAFYLGYLFFELPGSYIIQKLPLIKSLAGFVVVWGMILALHAAPTIEYPTFILLRVLLGCMESVVTPVFTVITSQYWKRDEQFLRTSLWFAFNGLGTIWGNAIAYGLLKHKDSYPIAAWRLLFVITGYMTVFLGVLIFFHLPDNPSKAWFLTEEEKLMVVERIRANQQGFGSHKIKTHQIIEALKDVRTWLFFFFSLIENIPNGGITNFFSILLNQDFGYKVDQSLLLGMPGGAIEVVACPLFAYLCVLSAKKDIPVLKYRLTWATISMIIAIAGVSCLAFAKHNKHAKLFGALIYYVSPVSFICVISLIATNVAGTSKKMTVNGLTLIGYCAGNIIGPQTFLTKEAPNYQTAKTIMVVCYIISALLLLIMLIINLRENKRRDKMQSENHHVENLEFADLTDWENPNFRYAL